MKTRPNKRIELTPRKLEEIKAEAIGQAMILTIAYLMDELNYDADECVSIWEGVTRYAEAVGDRLITMDKVCNIINDHTGLNIKWNKR